VTTVRYNGTIHDLMLLDALSETRATRSRHRPGHRFPTRRARNHLARQRPRSASHPGVARSGDGPAESTCPPLQVSTTTWPWSLTQVWSQRSRPGWIGLPAIGRLGCRVGWRACGWGSGMPPPPGQLPPPWARWELEAPTASAACSSAQVAELAARSLLGSALLLSASQRQTGRWRTVQAEQSTATVSSPYGDVPVMGTGPGRRPRPWQTTR
jgi:hypothetical protein